MILSHRHRFIFIRTAKTASSSLELALETLCGPEDICPPLSKHFEEGRVPPEERGYVPRNYRGLFRPRWRSDAPLTQLGRDLRDLRLGRRYWNHMSAYEVKARAGAELFARYFKFCFERNPWDRTVSSFFWQKSRIRGCPQDFETYVRTRAPRDNRALYSIGGRVAVDFIGRYESLEDDLAKALARVGVTQALPLPRAKSEWRPKDRSYRDYYTGETRDIVAKRDAAVIALLGYEF